MIIHRPTRRLLCILLGSVILIAGVLVHFFVIEQTLTKSLTRNDGDYVVLLHGLGRTNRSMQTLGRQLAKAGYRVINVNYPSRRDTIEQLTEDYLEKQIDQHYTDRDKKINFVTHSMGGAMIRYFLFTNDLPHLHRVVMIAPPSRGSEAADRWSRSTLLRALTGPAIEEMTTDSGSLVNTLPTPTYEVGVIAGEFDRKVSVEQTKLETMKDFLLVPREHNYLMNTSDVIAAVLHFLESGTFTK